MRAGAVRPRCVLRSLSLHSPPVGTGYYGRHHSGITADFCYAMLCCAMLCYVMLCYAMLCYAMLCYAMLCYMYAMRHLLCYGPSAGAARPKHDISPLDHPGSCFGTVLAASLSLSSLGASLGLVFAGRLLTWAI